MRKALLKEDAAEAVSFMRTMLAKVAERCQRVIKPGDEDVWEEWMNEYKVFSKVCDADVQRDLLILTVHRTTFESTSLYGSLP